MHASRIYSYLHIAYTIPVVITHLVEWIADLINVFNLHIRQSSAVFSVHYVLVKSKHKVAVRIALKALTEDQIELQKYAVLEYEHLYM